MISALSALITTKENIVLNFLGLYPQMTHANISGPVSNEVRRLSNIKQRFADFTDDQFIDYFGTPKCLQCARHQKCERLSKVELAKPWFASCPDGKICADFEPPEYYILLKKYWRGCDIYYRKERQDLMIPVCLNHDQSVRYYIAYSDFYYNTMFDSQGNLKWVYKKYYRRTRNSEIGYRLMTESNTMNTMIKNI